MGAHERGRGRESVNHPRVARSRCEAPGARRAAVVLARVARVDDACSSSSRSCAGSSRTSCTSGRRRSQPPSRMALTTPTLAIAIGAITASFFLIQIGEPIAVPLGQALGRKVDADLQRSVIVASLAPLTIGHLETEQVPPGDVDRTRLGELRPPTVVGGQRPRVHDHRDGLGAGVGVLPRPVRLVGAAHRDGRLADHDVLGHAVPGGARAGAHQERHAAATVDLLPRPCIRGVERSRGADLRAEPLAPGTIRGTVASRHGSHLVGACVNPLPRAHGRRGSRRRLLLPLRAHHAGGP